MSFSKIHVLSRYKRTNYFKVTLSVRLLYVIVFILSAPITIAFLGLILNSNLRHVGDFLWVFQFHLSIMLTTMLQLLLKVVLRQSSIKLQKRILLLALETHFIDCSLDITLICKLLSSYLWPYINKYFEDFILQ